MSDVLNSVADVRERLHDVRTMMLTTPDEAGTLSSRPVTVQEIAADGAVWFLVDGKADWVRPADGRPVNCAAVDGTDTWVSFAGRAEIVEDPARVAELSDSMSDAYFEEGAEPVALRAATERIEWWTSNNSVATMIELARARLTDHTPDLGESGAIDTATTA